MSHEINPEHPVTTGLHDEWYKICAIILNKLAPGQTVIITSSDIEDLNKLFPGDCAAILAHDTKNTIRLSVISETEARRKVRQ